MRRALLPLLLAACTATPDRDDVIEVDLTFRDDALVLEDPLDVEPSEVVPDAEAGRTTWTWEVPPDALEDVMPGDVLVSSDLGLVRVLSVDDTGEDWVLLTEEAALTDAVEEGTIAWDVGFHPDRFDDLRALVSQSSGTAQEWQGTIADFELAYQITPVGDDFKGKLSARYTKGVVDLRLASEALVKGFRQTGGVVIENGELVDVDLAFDPLILDGTMQVGGVEGVAGQVTFNVPLKLYWPFALGPLPAFVGVGAAMEVDVRMNPDSGTTQEAHFVIEGRARVRKDGSGWDTSGSLDRFELTLRDASDVSLSGHGIGTLAKFPVIEVGIGVPGRVETVLFTELNTEVVNNFSLISEGGFVVGNCRKIDLGLQNKVGGRIKAFALSLQEAQVTFAKTKQEIAEERPGDCELVP